MEIIWLRPLSHIMLLFQKKGEGLVPLKRLIPLQMCAAVLSQESDVE